MDLQLRNNRKTMDKEKVKILSDMLEKYKKMQENGHVNLIEFHTADGQKHGIGNPDAIKLLLETVVMEAERQLHKAQFGDAPPQLEQSREYKAAMALESAVNSFSFNPRRFAEALPYMHRTNQQSIFRLVMAIIAFMADDNYRTDRRNRASHDISKRIAEAVGAEPVPLI